MKKIFTLLTVLFFACAVNMKAQDTLLYQGFQLADTIHFVALSGTPPAGNIIDTMWYDYDADQATDANNRPGSWFRTYSVAHADVLEYGTTDTLDTNVVMASSSWYTNPAQSDDWLITPNIKLGNHDTLFWRSAPSQTPRYLDGYEVKLSTTTNSDLAFTHILFTAAEMTAINGTNDSVYAGYTFSTPGFVHGLDGTYIEYDHDSARLKGVLHPFIVPLDSFANQNVFIAFHHNSYDDNLITIDDILIRGTPSNPAAGIVEKANLDLGLNVFPNPAEDNAQLNFQLANETEVTINVFDVTGKLIYTENKGKLLQGRHFATINTSTLSKGFYTVGVQTNNSRNTTKLIVK